MNKINGIETEEIKGSSEATEPHFDNEGYQERMDKIEEEKIEQKERNLAQASELTEVLLKNEEMPINDFIDNLRKDGLNEEEIAKKLIIQGYSWDEFMNSSIDENIKLFVENDRKGWTDGPFRYRYIFRFKDKNDFNDKFFDILKEGITKGIDSREVVKIIPLKRTITMEDIINGEKKMKEMNPDAIYTIDLSGEILPDLDWSESREVFNYLAFDDKTFSKTSKEHLPEGFDPKEVFEKGKSIGLGIDYVHKMGYTGKGVSVAICDNQLLPHKDIRPKEYTVEYPHSTYFHASAVGSILAGKETGIAPDSNLYYFAALGGNDLESAFSKILEKNKQLPDNEKIRVISISAGLSGEGTYELRKKLEESGVWVLYSGEFGRYFGYLEKKDPMGDPNDFQNYQHVGWEPENLFVNAGDRTVASSENDNTYRHDPHASTSRAVPVVAGYYVLACQADPSMTPEKFKQLARKTSHEIDSTIRNQENSERSTETRKIKVIDIKALIQKIEEEKNK